MDLSDLSSINTALESASNVMTKSLMSLKANDVIKAQITDITPDSVKLKLADNSIINARSLVIPEASIGQTANFIVKSNNNGQIALEILKENTSNVPESLVKNILNSLEIPVNRQNSDIVVAMLENNITVNQENVNKAMFFKYSMPDNNMDDALFLLKENFPANNKTIDIFKDLINNNNFFKENVCKLADYISKLPDSPEKTEILKELGIKSGVNENSNEKLNINENPDTHNKLKINDNSADTYNKIIKKLFVDTKLLKKDSNEIPHKLSVIEKTAASDLPVFKNSEIAENVRNISEFMKNVDTTKQFTQIPVLINGKEESCELYVFNNKKGGKNEKTTKTMLLSLDTANLGKTEIYIEKDMNNLRFQFRLEKPETVRLFKSNIKTLAALLKMKNLNLSAVSYLDKKEKFSIQNKSKDDNVPKQRFSFDMHV